MARMSKEEYLEYMDYVNRGEGKNYRVPPSIWEKPEGYLTPQDKREMVYVNGIIYGLLGLIAAVAIGIGSCVYGPYETYQKKHNKAIKLTEGGYQIENTTNPQTIEQKSDLQRLNPLEKRVLTPRINNTATPPLHRTRNNQQLPNKNIAYPRFYTQSK